MKQVIICIHGFKTGSYHDFDLFERFLQEHPDLYQGEVVKVHLYDMDDRKSFNRRKWKKVAMNAIAPYVNENYQISLMGYSMGCGLACFLASKVRVEKLVLIAPLYHLFGTKMFGYNIKLYFKNLKMKIFNRKKFKKMQRFRALQKKVVPFKLTLNIALSIWTYKRYVKKVKAETLVMLGLEDDYSPLRSAHYAFKKVKSSRKELWFIDHINHLFIFSADLAPAIFGKLVSFINGQNVTITYL